MNPLIDCQRISACPANFLKYETEFFFRRAIQQAFKMERVVMVRPYILNLLVIVGMITLNSVNAELHPRDLDGNLANGHEAVYDDVLHVTWLANANLAKTKLFGLQRSVDPDSLDVSDLGVVGLDGQMSWDTAALWIDAMNTAGYLGFNDWRLPKAESVNGDSYNTQFRYDGLSDVGYNISVAGSASAGFIGNEMAYMYYTNLQALSRCFGTGRVGEFRSCRPFGFGVDNAMNTANLLLFTNIGEFGYASGNSISCSFCTSSENILRFLFNTGSQSSATREAISRVWAVRDGDIDGGPRPEPPPTPAPNILQPRDLDRNPDNGYEAYYDPALDILWSADPTAAGKVPWDDALLVIANLNSVNYLGYSDWRLPNVTPVDGLAFNFEQSNNGSTDQGYHGKGVESELGHLFYSTLGNLGFCREDNANPSSCGSNAIYGRINKGPFETSDDPFNPSGFQRGFYWFGVETAEEAVFTFSTSTGLQHGLGGKLGSSFVWPVRDGDAEVSGAPPESDFDADDDYDVLLRRTDSGAWRLFTFANGIVESSRNMGLFSGVQWDHQAHADFDGDGDVDVLLRRNTDNSWRLFEIESGNVVSNSSVNLFVSPLWQFQSASDFDADGDADVLMRKTDTGQWRIFEMQDRQVVSSVEIPMFQNGVWAFQAATDFDGDWDSDILLRRTDNGKWRIFEIESRLLQGHAEPGLFNNVSWKLQTTGDMNRNMISDIVLRHTDNGVWRIFNISNRVVEGTDLLGLFQNSDWQVAQAGDYDADGDHDILLRKNR